MPRARHAIALARFAANATAWFEGRAFELTSRTPRLQELVGDGGTLWVVVSRRVGGETVYSLKFKYVRCRKHTYRRNVGFGKFSVVGDRVWSSVFAWNDATLLLLALRFDPVHPIDDEKDRLLRVGTEPATGTRPRAGRRAPAGSLCEAPGPVERLSVRSPAKVFTANNTPYFVNHLDGLPSPTENFVRNYGPRLHHIAIAVRDGDREGLENIEYVVREIEKQGGKFLLDVFGSKEEGLKQIFSSAPEHSSLIIEYVQRFGDFQGFFTKDNVARLTHAAGVEEGLREMDAAARAVEAAP